MLGAIKFGSSNRSSEVHFEVRKFVSKFPPNFRTSKRNWELGNELRNRVLKSELKSTIKSAICNRTERFSRMRRQNAPMFGFLYRRFDGLMNTAEKRLRMHQIMKIWRGI